MLKIHQLTFNPFSENTYLLENEAKEVVVLDPGMYDKSEQERFSNYLDSHALKPVHLWLTHAHLDHVFGVKFIHEKYGLTPRLHPDDGTIYNSAQAVAMQYGLSMDALPPVDLNLKGETSLKFGSSDIELKHTPGHSPGSISFILPKEKVVIGGDVLFQGSIGRTDLPGGNYDQLIQSIRTHLMCLEDDYLVYSGHGPLTNIGQERVANPYL